MARSAFRWIWPLRSAATMLFSFSPGSDFAEIAQLCRRHRKGFRVSLTSQASKMTAFRFQENGHFLHLADICPACRLRHSGNCTTNTLLAGIWDRRGLSKCPDRCIACKYLLRTRNHAAVYTDALLAGNGKQHLDIRMHCLPGLASLIQPCEKKSSAGELPCSDAQCAP